MSVLQTTKIVHILVLEAAQCNLANSAGSFKIGTATICTIYNWLKTTYNVLCNFA